RASSTANPDFTPEPTSMLDARSIYQSIRSLLSPVMELLRHRLPTLVGPARDDAAALLESEERLHEHLRALLNRPISAKRIRCHGAFFLPASVAEQEALLNAMLIEKALYELRYELDHRPDWVHIPLRGLRDLALK